MIPQDVIDEIMRRSDILEIVGEYVPLKRRGRNWFGLCPFHNEDSPSFSVNPAKQIFKCFGCGKGGNVIGFVQEIEHLSFAEAVHRLADRCGVTIPEKALNPAEQAALQEKQQLLSAHQQATEYYAAQLKNAPSAQSYLQKRGFDANTVEKFRLGFAPESDWQALTNLLTGQGYSEALLIKGGLTSRSAKNGRCFDKFHGRLMFPIRDQRGQTVAFGGRVLDKSQPKYMNSTNTPIYNKSSLLYNIDMASASIAREGMAIIMEGYTDVITAWQHGITNAVASCGTAFTPDQVRLLHRLAPPLPRKLIVVLCFDGDGPGAKAALASLSLLAAYDFIEPRVIVIPEKLDPDEFFGKYGARGWQRVLERYCYAALDYLLLRALEHNDTNTSAGKGAVVSELRDAVIRTKNNTERDSFISELSRKLRVSEDSVRADIFRGSDARREGALSRITPQNIKPQRTGHPANSQLLQLALSDKKIFLRAQAELGDDFASTEAESQLIDYINKLDAQYDYNPSSLFNFFNEENEGLRQLLLKLLQTEITTTDNDILADEYIRAIRRRVMTDRLTELQKRITAAESCHEDITALLQEKMQLTRELKHL